MSVQGWVSPSARMGYDGMKSGQCTARGALWASAHGRNAMTTLEDEARAACIEAFFEACECGVGIADNQVHDAIEKILALTVVSAMKLSTDFWENPVLRQFFLRHARLIGRVAGRFAQARGSSLMSEEDVFSAADQVISRASSICGVAGPGCQSYVDERL